MNPHGYVFVLTPIELLCPAGYELAPGHRIVQANQEQVDYIKRALEQFNTNPFFFTSSYENSVSKVPGEKPGDFKYVHNALPRESWRYWIIEFEGINTELQELEWTCALPPNDIELGFQVTFNDLFHAPAFGWNPGVLSAFFNDGMESMPSKQITQDDLDQIRRGFDSIKGLPREYIHIRRALGRFNGLRSLERRSEATVIGLISVIESLVSHAPKLTDSADSLSHQLRTKIPLLRKRFENALEHTSYFPGIQEEAAWKKLYDYRSKIVHGEDSQLTGDLKVLKDIRTVIAFLRETSKRLLQLSLHEPQFMTDLKKC